MKQEGNELYKQGKFEEAAQCYEEAIRLSVGEGEKDSVVAIYHQNLAAVYDALVRRREGVGGGWGGAGVLWIMRGRGREGGGWLEDV